jgi:hypothetical protein
MRAFRQRQLGTTRWAGPVFWGGPGAGALTQRQVRRTFGLHLGLQFTNGPSTFPSQHHGRPLNPEEYLKRIDPLVQFLPFNRDFPLPGTRRLSGEAGVDLLVQTTPLCGNSGLFRFQARQLLPGLGERCLIHDCACIGM